MATCYVAKKKIAIIGAGCSGLAAIKCCLDENLEPVCLEKSSDIGGLWNFSEQAKTGSASIYRSLVINTSKDMMMFSDFPPPDDYPHFLTHVKVLEYFRLYARHFGLLRHVRFDTEVRYVRKAKDYEATGRWHVTYATHSNVKENTKNNGTGDDVTVVEDVFDGVMICTGHHSVPYIPEIPGLENFKGTVLHSHSYKDAAQFQGKRVVILGMGNSAADIACDLARHADQVYLSSRRGAWIVPRTAFWGLPADMLANSRVAFTMPYRLLDWCVQVQANFRIDHDTYGLRPQHGVLNCHPTINDELPIHLVSGRVKTRPRISRVERNAVHFDDDSVCPCDVIIFATGYDYRVDFVDTEAFKVENNRATLYKYMFPPHLPHPSLAVIGLIQAIGAVMPISEIQSRWYTRLITGAVKLPTREKMEEDIGKKRETMSNLYIESRRHTMQTFWIDYMDQVASQIGARPNLWRMLGSDPELALKCYLGPCLPAQYRLKGPGAWPGARAFIVNALTRATRSRSSSISSGSNISTESGSPTTAHSRTQGEATVAESSTVAATSLVVALDHHNQQHSEAKEDSSVNDDVSPASSPAPYPCPRQQMRRESQGRLSPEWKTLTFYIAVMVICCFAWLLSILFNQAESLLNVVDGVVDTHLPLSD